MGDWYLSNPDATRGPDQANFGYGEDDSKKPGAGQEVDTAPQLAGDVEMVEVNGYLTPANLIPRQVGPTKHEGDPLNMVTAEDNMGKDHTDDVDDKVQDFMKMFDE